MKKSLGIIVFLCIVSSIVSRSETSGHKSYLNDNLKPFRLEGFISPETCGNCHDEIFDMWNGTMHSQATADPLFRAATKLFVGIVTDPGEVADAEHCIGCHNPIAYRSGQIKGTSDNYDNVDDVTKYSISCDMCHSINEIVELRNASFNTDPGNGEDDPGVKRGPRDDAESMYHETVFSDIHASPRICGTCHNVYHLSHITKLEGTYDEWYNSPYNSADESKVVACQDCHMHQAPGIPSTGMTDRPDFPGQSAMMGKERPHIYRHSVIGANTFTTALLGYPQWAELAAERLKHAAVLDISIPEDSGKRLSSFTVRVSNEGAGHMLPTGVTEFRQMWLEVEVTDRKGKTVYSSGKMNPDASLPDGTCIFNTVFGDSEGNPTFNVATAAVMLTDHRIPPKGYVDESFFTSEPLKLPLTIHARLNYRSLDPAVVESLLGEKKEVPVVVMAEAEKVIE
ncbi:multiheme c-type cytochrome [Candidatus Latescibacterota bacterium]